ncbi:MAG: endonuclease domain-containing protein [Proteobacteria bacterium]|nr:endonuclease domain-containing protein [Pseudomonadota bacterium]
MRREPTDAERKLWFLLRDRRLAGAKVRRQTPVGPYIADFICLRRKLIVEADGGHHIGNAADLARDRWLSAEGYCVVRYSNFDVLRNPNGVLEDLTVRLQNRPDFFGESPSPGRGSRRSPRPPSPPEGRG